MSAEQWPEIKSLPQPEGLERVVKNMSSLVDGSLADLASKLANSATYMRSRMFPIGTEGPVMAWGQRLGSSQYVVAETAERMREVLGSPSLFVQIDTRTGLEVRLYVDNPFNNPGGVTNGLFISLADNGEQAVVKLERKTVNASSSGAFSFAESPVDYVSVTLDAGAASASVNNTIKGIRRDSTEGVVHLTPGPIVRGILREQIGREYSEAFYTSTITEDEFYAFWDSVEALYEEVKKRGRSGGK